MNIKIRKLTKKDLPEFHNLFKKILASDFPEYRPKISGIYSDFIFNKKFYRGFIKKRMNSIIGAFINNNLVGFLVVYGHGGGVAEFIWLGVDRTYRKKGVGTKLLQTGEKWALKNKFHHVFFHTLTVQHVEYYQKRGYENVGLQKKLYFGIDEFLMQKIISNEPFAEIFSKYF